MFIDRRAHGQRSQSSTDSSSVIFLNLLSNAASFFGVFLIFSTAMLHPRPREFTPGSFKNALFGPVFGACLYIGAGSFSRRRRSSTTRTRDDETRKEEISTRTVDGVFGYLADPAAPLPNRILGMRVPVAIGLISYPLYLYHWPLIGLAHYCSVPLGNWGVRAKIIVLATLLAVFSYKIVETPVRQDGSKPNKFFVSRYVFGGGCCCGRLGSSRARRGEDRRGEIPDKTNERRLDDNGTDFLHGILTFWLLPLVLVALLLRFAIRADATAISFPPFWSHDFVSRPGSEEQLAPANRGEIGYDVPMHNNGTTTNGTNETRNNSTTAANPRSKIDWQHGKGKVDAAKSNTNKFDFFMERLEKSQRKTPLPKSAAPTPHVKGAPFHGPLAGSAPRRVARERRAGRLLANDDEDLSFVPEEHMRSVSPLFVLSSATGFPWTADEFVQRVSALPRAQNDHKTVLPFPGFGAFLQRSVVSWGAVEQKPRAWQATETWFRAAWESPLELTNLLPISEAEFDLGGSVAGDLSRSVAVAVQRVLLKRRVLVLGDSHLFQMLPVLDIVLREAFVKGIFRCFFVFGKVFVFAKHGHGVC